MGEARRKKLLYGALPKTPKSPTACEPIHWSMISKTSTKLFSRDELIALAAKIHNDICAEENLFPEEISPEEIEWTFQEEAHLNRIAVLGECGCRDEGIRTHCFVDPVSS